AGARVAQGGNVLRRFQAGVVQILGQCTDDAVAVIIDLVDVVRMLASGFDSPGSRGGDDWGNPAGLGVEGVLVGHSGRRLVADVSETTAAVMRLHDVDRLKVK